MKTATFYLESFRHGRKKHIATKIAKSTTTTPIHLSEGGMFLAKLRVRFFCLYFSGNLLGMWEHYGKFHQMTIAHCFYRLFSMCGIYSKVECVWPNLKLDFFAHSFPAIYGVYGNTIESFSRWPLRTALTDCFQTVRGFKGNCNPQNLYHAKTVRAINLSSCSK